jgi:hypothetical protein
MQEVILGGVMHPYLGQNNATFSAKKLIQYSVSVLLRERSTTADLAVEVWMGCRSAGR